MPSKAKKTRPKAKKTTLRRARDRGEVKVFTAEISQALFDALEACRKRERRTRRALLELALEAYLSPKRDES
jgi:hypothetical protein